VHDRDALLLRYGARQPLDQFLDFGNVFGLGGPVLLGPAIDLTREIISGLAEFADAYPRELSGGMKMRVSLARALVTDPDILLMDEPFAALDALTRVRMQDELLALWDEIRFTVLFVTHSIPEAIKIGSRILLLSPHPGQVKAEINSVPRGQENSDEAAALGREIHEMLFADQIEEAPNA